MAKRRLTSRAADKGGLCRPSADSAPKANSTFGIFLPNPALAANACRWLAGAEEQVIKDG